MSMAVEVAPPAIPLPSMNMEAANIVGQRLPKTAADSPYIGMKTVLVIIVSIVHSLFTVTVL